MLLMARIARQTLHQEVQMIRWGLSVLLALLAGWLWWKLSHVSNENALLQAEIARLRAKARRLRT